MIQLNGTTYCIPQRTGGTYLNIGYHCGVLLDCGIGRRVAQQAVSQVESTGERVRYLLNTHAHMDHSGGNAAAKELTGATLLATREQQPYIEQKDLLEILAYGARPFHSGQGAFDDWETARVDRVIEPGPLELDGAKLRLISAKGHSLDHCFIAIPGDSVLFCGDVLLSEELMELYKLQFLLDVDETLQELDFLERADYKCFVHAHVPLGTDHLRLVDRNRRLLLRITELVYDFCREPVGREEIVGWLAAALDAHVTPARFLQMSMTVGAHLTYLMSRGEVAPVIESGILKFRQIDH